MSNRTSNRPPLSPREAWLSDRRQVLHFLLSRWTRGSQLLEGTVGKLLPVQLVLLPFRQPSAQRWRRLELSREEALKFWAEKRQQGWQATTPL